MKVFLSYRRDDTGGRAGRLFDVFARKYGTQKVFQDVSSASPGLDFTARIESTIASSDVVLVIIGPNWLSSSTATGERRIDQPDDFVRREVGAALATGKPVVPVLVDAAQLPRPEDLPLELADLVNRQAVSVRDTSWHQDVEALIDQLEGEPLPLIGRKRTTAIAIGAVLALVVVSVVVVLATREEDGGASDDDEMGACPTIDNTWTPFVLSSDPAIAWSSTGREGDAEVVDAWWRADNDHWEVVLDVKVTNNTAEIANSTDDDFFFNVGDVNGLVVNGADQGDPDCFDPRIGDQQLGPGRNVTTRVSYETLVDPSAVPIELELLGSQNLEVTGDDAASGSSGDDELTGCPAVDETWTAIDVAQSDPVEYELADGHRVEGRIDSAWTRTGVNGNELMVGLDVRNVTENDEATSADDVYVSEALLDGINIDDVAQEFAWCKIKPANPELEPTERAVIIFGWENLSVDPSDAAITLEAFGDRDLEITAP